MTDPLTDPFQLSLQRADQAIKKAQAVAGADTELHVGCSPTPSARLLPIMLRADQRAMPEVRVRLYDWRNDENLAGLRQGRLHLAFVFLLPRKAALGNLRFEALTQESARRAVSPKHPFTRRDRDAWRGRQVVQRQSAGSQR